jgi:hypothetical protein
MRTLYTVHQFSGGNIQELPQPTGWVQDAILAEKECEDWQQALSNQGAEIIESYGTLNETVDVWRCEGFGWLIDWQDTTSPVMSIYIDNVIDFAMFQTTWICPMATKIMAAEVYIRDTERREAEAEKAASSLH